MIERVRSLTQAVRAKTQAAQFAGQLLGFVTRLESLRGVQRTLAATLSHRRILRGRSILTTAPPVNTGGLVAEFSHLREEFKQDHEVITKADVTRRVKRAQEAAEKADNWLLGAWKEYAGGCLPSVNESTLDLLSKVPGEERKVQALQAAMSTAKEMAGRLPNGEEDLVTFDSLVEKAQRLWSSFESDQIPREVITFLKKATVGGAPLSTLTEPVREWLRVNDHSDGFLIRAKQIGS